jgi:hypothetical protein
LAKLAAWAPGGREGAIGGRQGRSTRLTAVKGDRSRTWIGGWRQGDRRGYEESSLSRSAARTARSRVSHAAHRVYAGPGLEFFF